MYKKVIYSLLTLALWSGQSWASPTVSVDMDLWTPGVQNSLAVYLGETFTIQLIMDTDGDTIGGIEFDLFPGGIGGNAVQATAITVNDALFGAGDTAGFPNTVVDEETLDNGTGAAAGTISLGFFGTPANGTGYLIASLEFLSIAEDVMSLDLMKLHLFDAEVIPGEILPVLSVDGVVTVNAHAPVPGSVALLLIGLLGVGMWRKRSHGESAGAVG